MNALSPIREQFLAVGCNTSPPVLNFAGWWLRNRPISPPEDCLSRTGTFTGLVLYREQQYQVQLFTTTEYGHVPHHTHPNVESLERLVCGKVDLNTARGNISMRKLLRVAASEDHWGSIENGAFFSFQKWLNGITPTSVTMDWIGEPLDGKHFSDLGGNDWALAHWNRLLPLIVKAVPFMGGTHDESDLLMDIQNGKLSFWPSENAFVITSVDVFPKIKRLNVVLANGDPREVDMLIGLAEQAAKKLGATKAVSAFRPGLERFVVSRTPEMENHAWRRISHNYVKEL